MQQQELQVNTSLLNYIEQYQQTKSRYEIDSYLLKQGHKPQEIEETWSYLQELPNIKRRQLLTERRRKKQDASSWMSGLPGIVCYILGIAGIMQRSDPTIKLFPNPFLVFLVLGVGLLGFVGANFLLTKRKFKWVAFIQLSASIACCFLALFTSNLIFLPLAFLFNLAGSLTLSSIPEMPIWAQKPALIVAVNLIMLTGIILRMTGLLGLAL